MHQSMHKGSMARAAAAPPISAVSHPNWSRTVLTCFFAPASLPQINIVGFPPSNFGFTISAAPTELKAFTKCAPENSCCNCSMCDSLMLLKNFSTPSSGGASSIGLVASTTVLPARLFAPAARSAEDAALPFTARTTNSPNAAAAANVPVAPLGFAVAHSASFSGVRLPIVTSWPCFSNPLANVFATSPDPRTPTFISTSKVVWLQRREPQPLVMLRELRRCRFLCSCLGWVLGAPSLPQGKGGMPRTSNEQYPNAPQPP